jgi:hypothetical protein
VGCDAEWFCRQTATFNPEKGGRNFLQNAAVHQQNYLSCITTYNALMVLYFGE